MVPIIAYIAQETAQKPGVPVFPQPSKNIIKGNRIVIHRKNQFLEPQTNANTAAVHVSTGCASVPDSVHIRTICDKNAVQ
jgi:hypothetical protein